MQIVSRADPPSVCSAKSFFARNDFWTKNASHFVRNDTRNDTRNDFSESRAAQGQVNRFARNDNRNDASSVHRFRRFVSYRFPRGGRETIFRPSPQKSFGRKGKCRNTKPVSFLMKRNNFGGSRPLRDAACHARKEERAAPVRSPRNPAPTLQRPDFSAVFLRLSGQNPKKPWGKSFLYKQTLLPTMGRTVRWGPPFISSSPPGCKTKARRTNKCASC